MIGCLWSKCWLNIKGIIENGESPLEQTFHLKENQMAQVKPIIYSHLTISGFVVDEKFQKNTSKFAIPLERENPRSFFFHFVLFYFPLKLMAWSVDIDQGIH